MWQVQACKEPWVQLHPRPEQLLRRLLGGGGPAHDRRRQHGLRYHHPDQPQVGTTLRNTGNRQHGGLFFARFRRVLPIFIPCIMMIFQTHKHSMPPAPPLLCRLWSSVDQGGNIKSIILLFILSSYCSSASKRTRDIFLAYNSPWEKVGEYIILCIPVVQYNLETFNLETCITFITAGSAGQHRFSWILFYIVSEHFVSFYSLETEGSDNSV